MLAAWSWWGRWGPWRWWRSLGRWRRALNRPERGDTQTLLGNISGSFEQKRHPHRLFRAPRSSCLIDACHRACSLFRLLAVAGPIRPPSAIGRSPAFGRKVYRRSLLVDSWLLISGCQLNALFVV